MTTGNPGVHGIFEVALDRTHVQAHAFVDEVKQKEVDTAIPLKYTESVVVPLPTDTEARAVIGDSYDPNRLSMS